MLAKTWIALAIVMGVLSTILINLYATKGYTIVIPYLVFTMLIAYQLKRTNVNAFTTRFKINFYAFFLISISLYISIILDDRSMQLSVFEHGVRVGIIIMIASFVSMLYSFCLKPANKSNADQ